jgi:hypothetical protein
MSQHGITITILISLLCSHFLRIETSHKERHLNPLEFLAELVQPHFTSQRKEEAPVIMEVSNSQFSSDPETKNFTHGHVMKAKNTCWEKIHLDLLCCRDCSQVVMLRLIELHSVISRGLHRTLENQQPLSPPCKCKQPSPTLF